MEVFFDNDIVQKLATADLLAEALDALSVKQGNVRVLGTARYKFDFKNPQRGQKKFGPVVYGRIHQFLAASQAVSIVAGADYSALSEVPGIDPGEAILFASAANTADSLFATGDKKCIRALAAAQSCSGVVRRLRARVICLEQLVERIMAARGFQHVLAKIVSGEAAQDGSLELAFARGIHSTESEVKEALSSFVRDVRREAPDILAP